MTSNPTNSGPSEMSATRAGISSRSFWRLGFGAGSECRVRALGQHEMNDDGRILLVATGGSAQEAGACALCNRQSLVEPRMTRVPLRLQTYRGHLGPHRALNRDRRPNAGASIFRSRPAECGPYGRIPVKIPTRTMVSTWTFTAHSRVRTTTFLGRDDPNSGLNPF